MPIYEFHCSGCQHDFEDLVFGNKLPEQCPRCGGSTIEKLLSAFSFKSAGGGNGGGMSSTSSGGGCGSCASKNCSSCR
jgi:putative FmdB family regulatory protein